MYGVRPRMGGFTIPERHFLWSRGKKQSLPCELGNQTGPKKFLQENFWVYLRKIQVLWILKTVSSMSLPCLRLAKQHAPSVQSKLYHPQPLLNRKQSDLGS